MAREAARIAGTRVLLEATIDRRRLLRAVRLLSLLPRSVAVDPQDFTAAYSHPAQITHRVDVRRQLPAKRAALAAHHSQTLGGAQQRTVALLLHLPSPLLRPVLGREWFIEVGPVRCSQVAQALRER